MLIRCRQCKYDRTGIPLDARCPECGSKQAYLVKPPEWRRFTRWPGVLLPAGAALGAVGAIDLCAGLWIIGPVWDAAMLLEAALIMALGALRWD